MKLPTVCAGAILGLALAFGAAAQPAPAPPASAATPEKLDLARQMVDAAGGVDQINKIMGGLFQSMAGGVNANLPPEQKRLQALMLQKMQQRFTEMTPKLVDITVTVYAENFSEQELRSYLAWYQSDTGRSIQKKLPGVAVQTMTLMMPLIVETTQKMKQDVVDEACAEAKCTDKDRQVIADAMAKAAPKQPS